MRLLARFFSSPRLYIVAACAFFLIADNQGAAPTNQAHAQIKRPPAPGIDGGVDWINTDKDLTLKDLRGRIVLLDFWTLC